MAKAKKGDAEAEAAAAQGQAEKGKGKESGRRGRSARGGRRRRSRAEEGLSLQEADHHGGGRRARAGRRWRRLVLPLLQEGPSRGEARGGRREAARFRGHARSGGEPLEQQQRPGAVSQGQDRA